MFSDLPDSQFWFRRFGLDYRIFQYFWRTLIKQQFLVIEVSNNDSKGMWFSRSDARCFKSSAWFSRGHNFPYMCLPHFLGACIEVHIRKSIFEMTIFTSFLYINHISFLIPNLFSCVFNFSDLPDSQRRAGTQSSSPSASDWLFSNCEMRQVLQTWTGERWD